jgi:hypothetical protein
MWVVRIHDQAGSVRGLLGLLPFKERRAPLKKVKYFKDKKTKIRATNWLLFWA